MRVEREPEDEAAGRGDLFQHAVGKPIDLSALTSAPDAAVPRDRHSFRMVEAWFGERAVNQHPHAEA